MTGPFLTLTATDPTWALSRRESAEIAVNMAHVLHMTPGRDGRGTLLTLREQGLRQLAVNESLQEIMQGLRDNDTPAGIVGRPLTVDGG
jgi:hypothetical protein